MLRKTPQRKFGNFGKFFKRGVVFAIVAESAFFLASFSAWYLVNQNRDYRKYLNDNYPKILDYYYKLGETFDKSNQIRHIDYTYWEAEKKN